MFGGELSGYTKGKFGILFGHTTMTKNYGYIREVRQEFIHCINIRGIIEFVMDIDRQIATFLRELTYLSRKRYLLEIYGFTFETIIQFEFPEPSNVLWMAFIYFFYIINR